MVPYGCALSDGFVIGARVSLLRQHSAERKMSASACTRSMPCFSIKKTSYSFGLASKPCQILFFSSCIIPDITYGTCLTATSSVQALGRTQEETQTINAKVGQCHKMLFYYSLKIKFRF